MPSKKHILTKSAFIRGTQCLKSLYLDRKRPFLRDRLSDEQKSKFKRGHEVGLLAQQLFPGGTDVSPAHPSQYPLAIMRTQELIRTSAPVIYEACFSADEILVMLDILVLEDNTYHAYEVKSSLKISNTYMLDAAMQYYVITRSGLELGDFSLIHLNADYKLANEPDLHLLFKKRSMLKEISGLQDYCAQEINKQKEVLQQPHSPRIKTGIHCHYPYPCDFKGICWKTLTECSVFNLHEVDYSTCFRLLESGISNIGEIPAGYELSPVQALQKQACQLNKMISQKQVIADYLCNIPYPLTFLTFLRYAPAIPILYESSPFDVVTYGLFTCIIDKPGGDPRQNQYLMDVNDADTSNKTLRTKLNDHLSETRGIIVWNHDDSVQIEPCLPAGQHVVIKELDFPLRNALFADPALKGDYSLLNSGKNCAGIFPDSGMAIRNDTVAGDIFGSLQNKQDISKDTDISNIIRYGHFKVEVLKRLFDFWLHH